MSSIVYELNLMCSDPNYARNINMLMYAGISIGALILVPFADAIGHKTTFTSAVCATFMVYLALIVGVKTYH